MNARIVAVMCLLTAALPARSEEPPAKPGRRLALLVGANSGVEGGEALRYAESDADRLARTLTDLGGFAANDVVVLKDPTPAAVLSALEAQTRTLRDESGETLVLFYFSGHADPQALYTNGRALPLTAIKERLDASTARLRVGILDACHGGGWTRAKGLTATPAVVVPVPRFLGAEGTALLASSSGLEKAHESETIGASFFTHHLIAGLRGAAEQTPAGEVTLLAAYRYAQALTVRDSALFAQAPQHPSYDLNLHGRDDLVLAQVSTGQSQLNVTQTEGPLQLVELPSGETVLELPAGERSVRLAVQPGRYLLRRQSATDVYARELDVRSDQTTEVSEASLTLIGRPALTAKQPAEVAERPLEPRTWEFTGGPAFTTSMETRTLVPGVFLEARYRFHRRFGVRARGQYVFDSSASAYVASARASGDTSFLPGTGPFYEVTSLFGVDAFAVPVMVQLGSFGRLELEFALGTSGSTGHLIDYQAVSAAATAQWVPLSGSVALKFYFNQHFAISVEAATHLVLKPQINSLSMVQLGLTYAP